MSSVEEDVQVLRDFITEGGLVGEGVEEELAALERLATRGEWRTFTGTEKLSGLYWVAGNRVDYDVDIDDYGRTIGAPDGTAPYISLVVADIDNDSDTYEVAAVAKHEIGDFDVDDYAISYYMPVVAPAPPKEDAT